MLVCIMLLQSQVSPPLRLAIAIKNFRGSRWNKQIQWYLYLKRISIPIYFLIGPYIYRYIYIYYIYIYTIYIYLADYLYIYHGQIDLPKKETSLPTIHLQVQTAGFWERRCFFSFTPGLTLLRLPGTLFNPYGFLDPAWFSIHEA